MKKSFVVISSLLILSVLLILPFTSAQSEGNIFSKVWSFFFGNSDSPRPAYSPNETYRACSMNNTCIMVEGNGTDQCFTNNDCTPKNYHVCSMNNTCIVVPGNGTNECYTNNDCMPKNETHRACSLNNTCVTVPGKGTNECSVNNDCKILINKTFGQNINNVTGKVFVTSFTVPNPNFITPDGADAYCEQARKSANLTGAYAAWISFANVTNAKDRVLNIKYVRTDGVKVVDNKADLIDGSLDAPINHDQFGKVVNTTYVLTGTKTTGIADIGNTCNDWKGITNNSSYTGARGDALSSSGTWTKKDALNCKNYFNTHHLYCFQI